MNLFSVHNASDGSVVLYLEEQDANLDLLEDVVAQVPLLGLLPVHKLQAASPKLLIERLTF